MIKCKNKSLLLLSIYAICLMLNAFAATNDPPFEYPTDPISLSYYKRFDLYDYREDRPCLQLINAWPITTGSSNVIVGIVGGGIYPFAELDGRLVPGHNAITGTTNTISATGEDDGLATILGANANNGKFAAGIDWKCQIMPIVVKDAFGQLEITNYARGIDYAASHGCKVILCASNCGTNYPGDILVNAVSNAIAHGSIVVAGGFSQGDSATMVYPGAISGIITAKEVGYYPLPSASSIRNVDVSATYPSNMVTASAIKTNGVYTNIFSGKYPLAVSAAMVAGVCSLLVSVRPDLTSEEARTIISLAAIQPRYLSIVTGFTPLTGWGYVNAYNSLILAQTRIANFQMNQGVAECSWVSPVNASNREPYTVEFSPSVNGNWVAPDLAVYTYTTNRTFFRGTSMLFTNENLFCRLRLRTVPEP